MQLECRGLHSLVKAEKGNADVTAGTGDLSWQAKRKKFSKEKRKLRRIPSPFSLLASTSRTSNLQRPFVSWAWAATQLDLAPRCFLFGARPLWWVERGCENQPDPEGRLCPNNSAGGGKGKVTVKEWKHEREKEGQMQPG